MAGVWHRLTHFVGDLLVITPQFLIWFGVVAFLGWVACAVSIRRHHRRVAIVAGIAGLLLTIGTAADAVNAHYQYLPRVDDVIGVPTWPSSSVRVVADPGTRSYPHGTVVSIPIPGDVSGFRNRSAMVYLPPQYFTEPGQRFAVVYLLHGSPGAPVDWFRAADAAKAGLDAATAGTPVILVAPRVSRKWTNDSECVDRSTERIETYVTADVVPTIDRTLRTIPTAQGRGLAGMSAGGYCALNIGLRHRDTFRGILDMSGFDRPTFDGGMAKLFGPVPDLTSVVAANTPATYVPTMPAEPTMSIWLDVGRSDGGARRDIENMDRELTARAQHVALQERPGGHDYGVWRPAFAEGLRWLAPELSRSANA